MKIFKTIAIAAVAAIGVSGAANASILFDFTSTGPFGNAGQGQHTFTYTQGPVDLTVIAFGTANFNLGVEARNITNPGGGNGLGVSGNDSTQVDNKPGGFPAGEWLAFSANVGKIVGAGIWQLNNGEEADFWASDTSGFGGAFTFLSMLPGSNPINPQLTDVDLGGKDWLLVATGGPLGENGFRVASIKVGDVPEPVTLALMGAGLAGIGFAGRRRKRA